MGFRQFEMGMRVVLLLVLPLLTAACGPSDPTAGECVGLACDEREIVCRDLSEREHVRPVGDLYVSADGNDSNDGGSYETAFATIQHGLDALEAGQTLIIGPGEYFGGVQRGRWEEWEFHDTLGSPDVDTVIRAEIPGTVLIRGDVPAPTFVPAPGHRHVYVAELTEDIDVIAVNELDSLGVLPERASVSLLERLPGGFYQDREAGLLYLSTTDLEPASEHRYSFSVVQDHGFALFGATRVIVDGISVTGFNLAEPVYSWSDYVGFTVWGILLMHCQDCVVRNSRAFFNARGIGVTRATTDRPAGNNLIENSMAWANDSPVATEDTGGITLDQPAGDEVRGCTTFLNGGVGINLYGGEANSVFSHNLSWGNAYADYKIKGDEHSTTQHSIGLGAFSHSTRPDHCLVGTDVIDAGSDTIVLAAEDEIDLNVEFADPDNFDFRLQSSSRFRGALDDGSDRGPHPFEATVFFVSPSGEDASDGLSVGTAWRTVGHAAERLQAGDTLYLVAGTYDEDVTWSLHGEPDRQITIRGRGSDAVVIGGQWTFHESQNLSLERLVFRKTLRIEESDSVSIDNGYFVAPDRGLVGLHTVGLRVTHSTFIGFADTAIHLPCSVDSHLAGNLFDNVVGDALRFRSDSGIEYSNYNSYARAERAWVVNEAPRAFDVVQAQHEPQSIRLAPDIEAGTVPVVTNRLDFAFGGPDRGPIGASSRQGRPERTLRLVDGPTVHSVSATTANIEWMTNLPTDAEIAWGDTPAMEHSVSYPSQSFGTISLTDLSPDTTYYFSIRSLSAASDLELDVDPIAPATELMFTTLAVDEAPHVYFVATDGNDDNDGLSRSSAFHTVQRAADQVNVGDTVRIGEGRYAEQVYIRATGATGLPITFTNLPGERAYFDGLHAKIANGFVVAAKSHLVFDGLYFEDHGNTNPWSASFLPAKVGDFNLHRAKHITISRSLMATSDFQEIAVSAWNVSDITLDNVALFNHFTPLYLHYAQNTVVRDSVIARPWIFSMIYYLTPGAAEDIATFERTIFTDMIGDKADSNTPLFYSSSSEFVQTDCVYVLRDEHAPSWRYMTAGETAFDAPDRYVRPLFVDPQFAAVEALIAAGVIPAGGFPTDAFDVEDVEIDFDSFFATNPEVTGLGIGLDPDRFDATGAPN